MSLGHNSSKLSYSLIASLNLPKFVKAIALL